jgi:hypothetical protein
MPGSQHGIGAANGIKMMERLSDRKWREPVVRKIFGLEEAE